MVDVEGQPGMETQQGSDRPPPYEPPPTYNETIGISKSSPPLNQVPEVFEFEVTTETVAREIDQPPPNHLVWIVPVTQMDWKLMEDSAYRTDNYIALGTLMLTSESNQQLQPI